jgi:phospholipid transport system substrate-binding protein
MKLKTTRNRWIRRSALAVVALALLAMAGADDDSAEARAVVDKTVKEVLEILARKDLSDDQRRQQIENIAYDRFDFETISRIVLAENGEKFSPEQRKEFGEQFKIQLSRKYGSRIGSYNQEQVKILKHYVSKNGDVMVRTRIKGGKANGIDVDYRLRKRDGRWLVIDFIVGGARLIPSYQAQYRDVLRHGSPEDLLRDLREKNAEKSAENSTEKKSAENADG